MRARRLDPLDCRLESAGCRCARMSVPGRIRTCDRRFRRPLLWSTELRGQRDILGMKPEIDRRADRPGRDSETATNTFRRSLGGSQKSRPIQPSAQSRTSASPSSDGAKPGPSPQSMNSLAKSSAAKIDIELFAFAPRNGQQGWPSRDSFLRPKTAVAYANHNDLIAPKSSSNSVMRKPPQHVTAPRARGRHNANHGDF
jgi:hypothetical protein